MSKNRLFTSGGRLREEALRLKGVYEQNNVAVFKAVQKAYGETTERWSKGVAAYERLTVVANDDLAKLEHIDGPRRDKYASAIRSAASLIQPAQFHAKTADLLQNYINELVLDRLEALEESQVASGLGMTIEAVRADAVAEELRLLLEEISSTPETEIDAFLRQKLLELQYVLKHYSLFGAEGVEHAVEVIIGGGLIKANEIGEKVPEPVAARLRRAGRIVKGALDAYVYSVQAGQSIEWTGGTVQAIGSWLSGGS